MNIIGPGVKATAMQDLVQSLKEQGVPIDGIGFEVSVLRSIFFLEGS